MSVIEKLVRILLSVFFDKRYLTGRFFTSSRGGYVWAIKSIWTNSILRIGRPYPWPTAATCTISDPSNLIFHPDDLNNFQSPGTYFQNFSATISIGRGTYIAPNVGIITANHQIDQLDSHDPGNPVFIGEGCWIGMNSIILPGVKLGPRTTVGAGSVVTRSFEDGNVVLVGAPARPVSRSR